MIRIYFIEHDGTRHQVDATLGESVMEAAVGYGVPGIDADCGGQCICSTCQVFASNPHWGHLPIPGAEELATLEANDKAYNDARLACQLVVTAQLEGATFRLPRSQR